MDGSEHFIPLESNAQLDEIQKPHRETDKAPPYLLYVFAVHGALEMLITSFFFVFSNGQWKINTQ